MSSARQLFPSDSGAVISADGLYRHRLWRIWDRQAPALLWVMLNPSTADAREDDPTIRRCIGFAKDWRYGGIEVVNLFAWRATHPSELRHVPDPVGPENDYSIRRAVSCARSTVAAWGARAGRFPDRVSQVMWYVGDFCPVVFCLGRTKGGHPRHPLMVRRTTEREIWRWHA